MLRCISWFYDEIDVETTTTTTLINDSWMTNSMREEMIYSQSRMNDNEKKSSSHKQITVDSEQSLDRLTVEKSWWDLKSTERALRSDILSLTARLSEHCFLKAVLRWSCIDLREDANFWMRDAYSSLVDKLTATIVFNILLFLSFDLLFTKLDDLYALFFSCSTICDMSNQRDHRSFAILSFLFFFTYFSYDNRRCKSDRDNMKIVVLKKDEIQKTNQYLNWLNESDEWKTNAWLSHKI